MNAGMRGEEGLGNAVLRGEVGLGNEGMRENKGLGILEGRVRVAG